VTRDRPGPPGGAEGFTLDVLPVRVRFGTGASQKVGEELDRLGTRRAVVFAGRRHEEVATALTRTLGERVVGVFADVRPHVPEELAGQARVFSAEREADTVVAIGGGSAIGLAKAVRRELPVSLVAIPTSYAGSEMTPIWGLSTAEGKQTGHDPAVLPDAVVYDPALARSMPAAFAATSGLNAIAHSVEALYAPGANPVTELPALEGLRLLVGGLPRVVRDGAHEDAGPGTLFGACLAGLALGQTGTSFHHKICHVLGGRFGMPHAATHAALLPHSVRLAADVYPAAVRRMAETLAVDDAAAAIAAVCAAVDAPSSLAELGLAAGDVDEAADQAARVLGRAGLPVTDDQVHGLLRDAFRPGA
jgi:maleylacetate reductase